MRAVLPSFIAARTLVDWNDSRLPTVINSMTRRGFFYFILWMKHMRLSLEVKKELVVVDIVVVEP